jgi:hypothetical protein
MKVWIPRDSELFPPEFPDVGGKSFLWVKLHREVFCGFVVNGMENTTGIFESFQQYLLKTGWTVTTS